MPPRRLLAGLLGALLLPLALAAQPSPGKNTVVIRGQTQEIYFYPAAGTSPLPHRKILFLPGDVGWRGLAITIAQTMASWGYDVYGMDTKRYLESFTGKTPLAVTDVMRDFREIARWMAVGKEERVTLVGWSEGAGLCLLGGAAADNQKLFKGLVAIGLGETSVLGWRWTDYLTYITGKEPEEPHFASVAYLPKVSPLPLLMLQATGDQYISVEAARRLFAVAKEPKRFVLIAAHNHRFDGNREGFFLALRAGLQWIQTTSP